MRGKRNEMPVVVEIKRSRGRPKKDFMPPVKAPAPAIVPDAEEQIAAIVNDLQWQDAEPAFEADPRTPAEQIEYERGQAAIDEEMAMIAARTRAEYDEEDRRALEPVPGEMRAFTEDERAALDLEQATEPAGVYGDGPGATGEAQGQPMESGILGNPETLAGDIRDQILNQIKRQEKPWGKMLNYEQAVLADQLYKISKEAVAGALKIILNVPFQHVDVRIDKIAVDKEIKVALSTPLTGGTLSKLGDALHLEACLILASAAEFQGQRQAPMLDPDQPGLQLDEEAPADHDHEAELI